MKFTYCSILFLLGVLLLACSSADAAIRAAFESPGDAQPVAGITTVRGWAFETARDSRIGSVTLIIDETLRQDIPCCAERGDIPLAFPAFPADQTLDSGWGTTFNWGLLSPGAHTLRVEIESTSGQIFSTETRTVIVVKPGDFEFLDSFDLSAADASIVGSQLVLKGVKVRDTASKQTKTVDVRFRWFENSQSLGATGSVTTDDGSGGPRFVFGDQVSAEDQRRMRESIELAMYYIQDETGVWINDYTVYTFADLENFLDVYLEETERPERERAKVREEIIAKGNWWASFEYTRTSGAGGDIFLYGEMFFSSDNHRLQATAHEYFHVIQHAGFPRDRVFRDTVRQNGPIWLIEGSAVYAQIRAGTHEGLLNFAGVKAGRMTQARKTAAPLQSLETQEAYASSGSVFTLGFMAVDFLVDNFGGLPALPTLVSFYDAIGPNMTWQDAFQDTFGISIDEFYAEFEAYRLEHFPPLP